MYKKTILKNQLRVITNEMKDRDSVSVGIWIAAGGRHEDKKNKGAAHFLEHILFKGTQKYSCEAIKEQIEGVGGTLNAFTSEEYTCYFAKIPSKHLDRTFDILSDMVYHPLIAKKDVNKERGVILEEIKMYRDQPQHFVIELLEELMWPGHPLGMNLAGSFESVGAMSEKDLQSFHRGHYTPANIVVAASGRLSHDHVVGLTSKKSAKFDSSRKNRYRNADNSQIKPKAKFFKKAIEQMHLAIGAFGLPDDHKDRHAYQLLNIILGGNMSSRLFDEVREKRGLAYAIGSSAKSLSDTGLFLIRAGVDNTKIVEAVDVILKELGKIRTQAVSKDEFSRAKDYYLGQTLLGLEDTLEHMFWIGESTVSLDRTKTLKDILREVNKVTINDIRSVADGVFQRKNVNLSIVGPLKDNQENGLNDLMKVS